MQKFFMSTLIQEVHRREQEIVEKNQNLVEMKRKNQTVSIVLTVMMSLPKLDESKSVSIVLIIALFILVKTRMIMIIWFCSS